MPDGALFAVEADAHLYKFAPISGIFYQIILIVNLLVCKFNIELQFDVQV